MYRENSMPETGLSQVIKRPDLLGPVINLAK